MGRRERIARWVVAGCLATALLAIGGAARWSIPLIAAAALMSAAPLLGSSRRFRRRPPLLVFLGVACAITAAQLVPLPAPLVGWISPMKWQLAADSAAILGHDAPWWMTLSLDSPGTLVELVKFGAYFWFAFACLRVTSSTSGRRHVTRSVALVGVGAAALAQLHHLLKLERLYGVYEPDFVTPYLAPLLNPNHLGGLLAMTACPALALALSERGTVRASWFAGFALIVGTNLLVKSRGGTIALAVGCAATVVLYLLSRSRRSEDSESMTDTPVAGSSRLGRLGGSLPAVVIASCALVLVVAFTASGVAAELAGTGPDDLQDPGGKLAAWRSSAKLMEDHRWTGVGRGAFEAAFTRVHPPSHFRLYSHVENEYLQAALDWGFPAAAALAVAFIWTLSPILRRCRNGPLEAGCTAAVGAIALQNLADFGLELPGIAMPTIACLAVVGSVRLDRGGKSVDPRLRLKRWLGVGGAALIAVVAITPLGRTVREERAVAGEHISRAKTAAAAVDDAVGAMGRHPADYYVPAAVASALFRFRDQRAVGFANHALTRHPTHAGLHRLAARMLESAKRPAQACLEWRHAIEYAENPRPVIAEMSQHRSGGETVARCVPSEGIPRPEILVMELERIKNPEAALLVARRAAESAPKRERLLRVLGRLELGAGNLEAAQAALAAAQGHTETAEGAKLLAEVLAARDKFAEAEKIILVAADAAVDEAEKIMLLNWLAEQMSLRKRHGEAKELLTRSLGLAGSDRKLLAAVHFRLARVERDLGNLHQAQWEEAKARELTGP